MAPLDDFTRTLAKRSLPATNREWTEDELIKILETSERKYDIYWASIALRDCGTQKCIPVLKAKINYPMQDVKITTMSTIAQIAGATETEFYAQALLSSAFREKAGAMAAICKAGDARAIDAVLSYFRKNLRKVQNGKFHNQTLPPGLDYLQKYFDSHEGVRQLFAEIKNHWVHVAEHERLQISLRIPYFRELQR